MTGFARGATVIRVFKPWLIGQASRVLRNRFGSRRARGIIDEAFRRYLAEASKLPAEQSIGGRMMVHCAGVTAALYRVLVDEGLGLVDAREQTARVTAAIYEQMAEIPWLVAKLSGRSPHARLKRATDAFRRFPFSAPAYLIQDVAADEQTVAFDVRRCPVAEYFRAQGLADLCVESWCNLDFPLAEKWGARLERTTTLARGGQRCDFRWRVRQESG